MTDLYEAKYEEMQKYVPFIQRVIEKLKVNNDHQADNPRRAQLQKMEMLHDLLTNKQKKIKVETLIKCEGVLIKLQTKIEKNEDSILSDIKMKNKNCTSNDMKRAEDILGPASPPPEDTPSDDINQPVVIPTERRCSPILSKEKEKQQQHNIETLDYTKNLDDSNSKHFQKSKKFFDVDCGSTSSSSKVSTNKQTAIQDKNTKHSSHTHGSNEHKHVKESQHPKHFNQQHRPDNHSTKERNAEVKKSPASEQKLQTVKVVITEPLPVHFRQQHFPPISKFLPRSSVCHNNLKTLPLTSQTITDKEAYSPKESWDELNETKNNSASAKKSSTAAVFSRLGEKIFDGAQKNTKSSGRYTPIPDVLKSPPLSVSDINDLLIESGACKTLKDISEIGTRRPPKIEEPKKESDSSSFEFVRKKLAQTAKLNSPQREKDNLKISSLPNERVALKYHPHPRQERLQSVSSTDSSECSTQSKINSPRINPKPPIAVSQPSPSQVPAINVNVLPAINLSDPRLKRQSAPLPTPPERKSLLSTPTLTPTQNIGFSNQNPMIYCRRKDPRISRITNNAQSSTAPFRRMSTNQAQHNAEENWDLDDEEKPLKCDRRYERSDCDNRNMGPTIRDAFNQNRLQKTGPEDENSTSKQFHQSSMKPVSQNEQSFCKTEKSKKAVNKLIPATTYVVPNAPKSDTEEDWDSEPEPTNSKVKPLSTDVTQSPLNIPAVMPVVPSYQSQISSKTLVTPHVPHIPPHIPQIQQQYPKVGPNIHHSYRPQNPQPSSRFSCLLNDSSERIKYLEAKKQKSAEPRTYKEFREAKERALAQEAAMKLAAEQAEVKKRNDMKEIQAAATKLQNVNEQKFKQTDAFKKGEAFRKEKKPPQKDTKKSLAGESTLDKMYRTQNFNTSFPKANTSFKIPKKKTEDKTKEDTIQSTEATVDKTKFSSNNKLEEKVKSNQTDTAPSGKIKSDDQDIGKRKDSNKFTNHTKANQNKPLDTCKPQETGVLGDKANKKDSSQASAESPSLEATLKNPKPVKDKTKFNSADQIKVEKISAKKHDEKEKKEVEQQPKENLHEHDNKTPEGNQLNVRDPRCRPKTTATPIETEDSNEPQEGSLKPLGSEVITSSENEVILKPQQNLEKFNQLTQQLPPKPQRILRRRNTMVVFVSAPLVDKEKLRKANALLFEDVQEEEKRKHKQAEEERLIARRNKILEEMFKKTDDNCTVSTQNIITGKRSTRTNINFNETVNTIKVFKHLTIKDPSAGNVNSTASASAPALAISQAPKTTRSNFKIKIKNLALPEKQKLDDDSDDDKPLNRLAKKEVKQSAKPKEPDVSKPETITKVKAPLEESDSESKTNTTKLTKKRATTSSKKFSNYAENEEHQNCAVSSTSTDNYNAVEETTCSSTSTPTHKSYKKEIDDNEPTSTASKLSNPTPTPTPEPSEPILREIVDQILQPNSNREPILGILAQILSEEKLALIKSLIESSNKQNTDGQTPKEVDDTDERESHKQDSKNNDGDKEHPGDGEDERKPIIPIKTDETKKNTMPKKKRSELDRLNEDIRDMFICNGVITATGRRMCTIMGKGVAAATSGKELGGKESTTTPISKQENCGKKKSDILKPPSTAARALRRFTRACKTTDDNEDNESILSRTTDDSFDDFNSTTDSSGTDPTPLRKMPVLKAHTPIKIPDDVASPKALKPKETGNKRKSEGQLERRAKKIKTSNEDADADEESATEIDKAEDEEEIEEPPKTKSIIRNTNIHWHNQSKYTTWCMICEKRIPANSSSVHYKTHHRENYISRMAPVLLQQYKQEKLSKPLFGVKKAQKQQPLWFYRCPFCLNYFNTSLPLWLEHFQNHTVEFRYECSKCFRSSNKKLTISRHIKSCEGGATVLTSAVKLGVSRVINAHVCHLCNFIQLKRDNLERHYIEQHELQQKTIDLLGYTIKLFDVENVECVSEKKAAEKEREAWKSIEKNEQVIDIVDDDDADDDANEISSHKDPLALEELTDTNTETCTKESPKESKVEKTQRARDHDDGDGEEHYQNQLKRKEKIIKKIVEGAGLSKKIKSDLKNNIEDKLENKPLVLQEEKQAQAATYSIGTQGNDCEMIDQKLAAQNIQDELLALAAEAEEKDGRSILAECNAKDPENTIQTSGEKMSNTISSSIDVSGGGVGVGVGVGAGASSTAPKEFASQAASNVFMPTRDEINYSPTIQILAQSIINIDEQENPSLKEKPITMAERLSQRFRELQGGESNAASVPINNSCSNTVASNENAFEKLIDDTLFELTKEKDSANRTPAATAAAERRQNENVFDKLFNDTILELEKDELHASEVENTSVPNNLPQTDSITVNSDDEDWEDIEITETAPAVATAASGNMQKSKSKGLFQKFGMFKGSSIKSKKHLSPMVFLPKKKAKEKSSSQGAGLSPLSPITVATHAAALSVSKANKVVHTIPAGNSNAANLGFKPVINIMDGLFPDSPCNDPIDLVPELAPLEPLQDLNDISSILDSNLSAVNINAADNHTSIEDALDFVSEQQANEKQKSIPSAFSSMMPTQSKTAINSIYHVGFSLQNGGENAFKFYCLLQNCSFLYSSDSIGLEAHFTSEHSQIKWNGYCLMCQSQCLPTDAEQPISKEIRHMMEKHANNLAADLNADSTQHSSNSSCHEAEGRPKIKLRRLTGDCLSRATPENVIPSNDFVSSDVTTTATTTPLTMLGALLVADPMPPTREMPPQPQMPLTEPLLLDETANAASSQLPFKNNVNTDFLITSVTSANPQMNPAPLQISSVVSLNDKALPAAANKSAEQIQMPKISEVRTLAQKAGALWTQQIESERLELIEAAAESLEVSSILQNAASPFSTNRQNVPRCENDSPVLVVAETLPIAQSKTGDFVVTQTLSTQYNEFSSTAVGFNISIAASSPAEDNTNTVSTPQSVASSSIGSIGPASIASRQYKCMGSGCKFVSRVPVAMSDHLRFHERRNFSNKQDYLSCGFCFYSASDVDDYMKHANQFHIINKITNSSSEADTATSLTKKINIILNNKPTSGSFSREGAVTASTKPAQPDTQDVYLKKLKATINEIVGPTGLADDKLYRCVVKNCQSHLTEGTFLSHIMFHISTTGANPNNYVYKCPHCAAQYHRAAGIKAHIKNHARNRYFCYLCDETTANPGQLLKHFSDKHWHTLNMCTKELLPPKASSDGSDSNYYVVYTQDLTAEEVRKFGENLILEWQRKKSGSKTHFKSSEIDLLPLSAIFQRQVNCGECEYKTKVRTNMFRHLLMHKQNPGLANKTGASSVVVDPVNPVPCLNSNERFFDKMTNLASSSLIPSTSTSTAVKTFKLPQVYVEENKRFVCGCAGCNYHTISDDLFRTHVSALHSSDMTYTCPFCKEEVCKRGISIDRILNHLRFHGNTIYRCGECNYFHHLRYVVERHINEKHSTMKVNMVTHMRSVEDAVDGTTTVMQFAGKKYNEFEGNVISQMSNPVVTRSTTSNESSLQKAHKAKSSKPTKSQVGTTNIATDANTTAAAAPAATTATGSSTPATTTTTANGKGRGKWECDVCAHKAATVSQIQNHCQQQHSVKNQYKCAHCNFGSQQLSQILHHIDEKHSGKTREARTMYHKIFDNEEVADTRPLWQRNDPTRVRHIRGILMEDEEESEEYRKKLALTEEDGDEGSNEEHVEENEELNRGSYISGYEFGCYHCSFKTQMFEDLKERHYAENHNFKLETAKPFWYRLHRRLCCPECRSFIGNYNELQQHLQSKHRKRFYAADVKMAENDDTSLRIVCGYCSFHCASADHLYRHHLKAQHWPQDIRIDNNEQIMEILALGKSELSYQCTLCADIFSNRVAIVQHACNSHTGEDGFSCRELSNSLIFRCNSCCFTSTVELELLRHTIEHYSRFKVCCFCSETQSSFNAYMQHCYAEHKTGIEKFRSIYPIQDIQKFLLQTLVIFPSGLVLNKRNLRNTQYGKTYLIHNIYEEIYKISQQPPIPRLSIARLVARKSIEAQHKNVDSLSTSAIQNEVFDEMHPRPKSISKRRCTVAFDRESSHPVINSNSLLKRRMSIVEESTESATSKRRMTNDLAQPVPQLVKQEEFCAPLQANKISKRRRTVAVDRDTPFSTNLTSSSNTLLTELQNSGRKRKGSSSSHTQVYPSNLDMEPYSFYGKKPKVVDLSKIYTKVAIGGIKTPLTLDKFRLLFNIDCQLKLTKCDEDSQLMAYNDYKHVKKACPASEKSKY